MSEANMTTPIPMFNGDPRYQTLYDALAEVLYERGRGLPLPATIGVLRLLEHEIIQNAMICAT